jgi:hypothetical protein
VRSGMSAGFKYAEANPVSPIPRLLLDAPEYAALPPPALRMFAWCYRYTETTPNRDEFMRAMTALATLARGKGL